MNGTAGKEDKRRPENSKEIAARWKLIDWSDGKKGKKDGRSKKTKRS